MTHGTHFSRQPSSSPLLRMTASSMTHPSWEESDGMALKRGQQYQQQADQQGWSSSGLLEEGELFYVDLSSDNVDGFGSPCDHESPSAGMYHHVAARLAIAEGEMPTIDSNSCGDTEAISKTDSESESQGMPRLSSLPESLIESNASAPASSRVMKVREGDIADPCLAMFQDVKRAWGCITGSQSDQDCEDHDVEYTCQHLASCTSFKHFGVFKSDVDVLGRLDVIPGTYAIQITRFRVTSTMWQRHEEYEVCLVGGGQRWVCWQEFSKFKLVADFCEEIDRSCSKAWVRVLMSRFHYRSLDREHLAMKCSVLEMFLKQVLFAIPTPAFLIQFISPTSNV